MKTSKAVAQINRVELALINEMSETEYQEYMAIPDETRKQMLYFAWKASVKNQ